MKLSTRLLLPLLATVVLVMASYSVWAMRQRQLTLEAEGRRATRAYATALGLALEDALEHPQERKVQEIVDRISREPEIYGVLVYTPEGTPLYSSDLLRAAPSPPALIRRATARSGQTSFNRTVGDQRVYSLVTPLRRPAGPLIGAFEVAQPLSFVEAEVAAARQRYILNTLTLLVALAGLILWLVRRMIARPLSDLLEGVRALGRGELTRRIRVDRRGGELADLAREFNRMADHLESARAELVRETDERLALEKRLRQSEKMAAIGSLAAGLAHEIAAPLNVVAGRAEMLLRRGPAPEQSERNLRIIVDQIGRITVIVRNLLDFARRREPQRRPHDLAEVLDAVVEFLDGEFERSGIEVRRDWDRPLWVHGDPHQLHQVFINLLLNAVHATELVEKEKSIWIRGVQCERGSSREGRQYVLVEVLDTGTGILEHSLQSIFEPFITSKPGGEGTGLGLAVARSIVDEHEGTIEADNWDAGAVFRLRLPAAAAPEPSSA